MGAKVDAFLRSGERVLHCAPAGRWIPNWRARLNRMVGFGVLVLLVAWLAMEPEQVRGFAIFWIIFWSFVTVVRLLEDSTLETGVTDRRLLRIAEKGEGFDYDEVALDAVAATAWSGDMIWITKTDGTGVVLKHKGHAREIATALAQAAGLAPPGTRPFRVRFGSELLSWGVAILAGGGYAAASVYAREMIDMMPSPWLGYLIYGFATVAGAILAAVAGGFAILAALRHVLAREELVACVQDAELPFEDNDPLQPGRLAHRFLRFVDWLYGGAAPAPSGPGGQDGA